MNCLHYSCLQKQSPQARDVASNCHYVVSSFTSRFDLHNRPPLTPCRYSSPQYLVFLHPLPLARAGYLFSQRWAYRHTL